MRKFSFTESRIWGDSIIFKEKVMYMPRKLYICQESHTRAMKVILTRSACHKIILLLVKHFMMLTLLLDKSLFFCFYIACSSHFEIWYIWLYWVFNWKSRLSAKTCSWASGSSLNTTYHNNLLAQIFQYSFQHEANFYKKQ